MTATFLSRYKLDPPQRIYGVANADDVDERRAHLEKFLDAVAGHVAALLCDLNQNLPVTLTVDSGDFARGLSDLIGDTLSGPLMRVAEQLAEDEMENPPTYYVTAD